uniref:Uncharacterized protein n=1 Tax=Oryza barthii TaxID=65489 RepID=A0A0D3FTI0_9ORYZ
MFILVQVLKASHSPSSSSAMSQSTAEFVPILNQTVAWAPFTVTTGNLEKVVAEGYLPCKRSSTGGRTSRKISPLQTPMRL